MTRQEMDGYRLGIKFKHCQAIVNVSVAFLLSYYAAIRVMMFLITAMASDGTDIEVIVAPSRSFFNAIL